MVSLDDVSVFVAVVEKQSFSAAARELRISPSAVSKRITRLEYQLRATLINRSSRRISLSAAGSAFFERCAGIKALVNEATRAVQSLHSAPGGKLRIHVTAGVGIKLITPLIPSFLAQFPNVSVELITHVDETNVVQQGGDILITSVREIIPDKSLDHRDLGICYYAICATPDYLRRVGSPKTPRDLAQHNCLLYYNEKGQLIDQWPFEGKNGSYSIAVRGSFAANNSAALYEALIRGSGLALMPVYSVFEAVAAGKLQPLFLGESKFKRSLRAYFLRSPHIPINVRLFLDFVTAHLGNLTLDKSDRARRVTQRRPLAALDQPHPGTNGWTRKG